MKSVTFTFNGGCFWFIVIAASCIAVGFEIGWFLNWLMEVK